MKLDAQSSLLHARLSVSGRRVITRARSQALRFSREEDGSILVFIMAILMVILVAGGMAVDFMRTEYRRAGLQETLDRAVLAAADLDQTLKPKEVVADYFKKAGYASYLGAVTLDEGLNYRTVTAESSADVSTAFLKLAGIDSLPAIASGGAEERIGDVEISMVLDNSGSMGSYSRLTNMVTAAKEFVTTMFENSEEGRISISLVPYATQVSVNDALLAQYNVTSEHNYSGCVDFPSSAFNTTEISTSQQLQRTGHFDPWTTSKPPTSLVCKTEWHRKILPLSGSENTLQSQINNFTASGNTSTDIGVKWGAALLDPSMQPVVSNLIASGDISSDFVGRPAAYDDADTIKAMIVMSDGVNTSQYYLNNGYEAGNSNVYYNASNKKYSIRYTSWGNTYYYWVHNGYRKTYPYGGSSANQRLTFPELWAQVSIPYNAYYFQYPTTWNWNTYNDWYYDPRSYVGSSEKDTRMSNICSAAKAQGVVIYTIGFEMTESSAAVLEDCASSPSHHFNVDGVEISDAFSAIASSINQLRLIQ